MGANEATSKYVMHDANSHLYIHFRDMLKEERESALNFIVVTDILHRQRSTGSGLDFYSLGRQVVPKVL